MINYESNLKAVEKQNNDSIYYECLTIHNYYESAHDLLNEYHNNSYEKKIILNNYDHPKVFDTEYKFKPTGNSDDVKRKNKKNKYQKEQINYDNEKDEYLMNKMSELIYNIDELARLLEDNHRVFKQKKNIEAVYLKILLPYDLCINCEQSKIKSIAKKLITSLKPDNYTLPYLATVISEGKGFMLKILYLDRQFYRDGIDTESKNITTRYRCKITKKYLKPEIAKTKNADEIIIYPPGSIVSTKKVYFSSKVTDYWCGPFDSLESKRTMFKAIIRNIFISFNIVLNKFKKKWIKTRALLTKERHLLKSITYNRMFWWLYRKNKGINSLINEINTQYYLKGLNHYEKDEYLKIINLILKSKLNCQKFEWLISKLIKIINSGKEIDCFGTENMIEALIFNK
jgi:hypothetical protein